MIFDPPSAVTSPHALFPAPIANPLLQLRVCTASAAVVIAARASWLYGFAWLAWLALVPWWLDMGLLLAMVAALLIPNRWLAAQAPTLRRALRWGLPGMLLALQRGLGGDALAWGVALLGALAGFTLLAGLEAWLDRGQRRSGGAPLPTPPEWPASARGSLGPPAVIIELTRPRWCDGRDEMVDPRGGVARWQPTNSSRGRWRLGDGRPLDDTPPRGSFSPDGRWFAAQSADDRGLVLLDRAHDRVHRLHGWKLYGWHLQEPWLRRGARAAPVALREVLGELRQRGRP